MRRRRHTDWKRVEESVNGIGMVPIICSKSQFKGNTLNMMTKDRKIVISNQYYSGHVTQIYDIDEDITQTELATFNNSAKWLTKKLTDICTQTSEDVITFKVKVNERDQAMLFGGYMYTSSMKIITKGLALQGNIGNLNMLKKMTMNTRRVRNIIKSMSAEELLGFSIITNEELIIDVRDLKDYDRRMSDRS